MVSEQLSIPGVEKLDKPKRVRKSPTSEQAKHNKYLAFMRLEEQVRIFHFHAVGRKVSSATCSCGKSPCSILKALDELGEINE
jgi:hypothetical protein